MTMRTQPGDPVPSQRLADIPALVSGFFSHCPDPTNAAQRVSFGTSGHRGSSLTGTFNEAHVLAITQAICDMRRRHGICGPLFLGRDTHALSTPAHEVAIEVLGANGVEVCIADADEYTPTPAVSHAILSHNRGRHRTLADGILLTPSHNPPQDGGLKYNPPSGGPAPAAITGEIERAANTYLESDNKGVRRMPLARALAQASSRRHDYITPYVRDLAHVVDMEAVRAAGLHIAADALGGAGLAYWEPIAAHYGLDLTVLNAVADPTFRFMRLDHDGEIRMDCSSPHAMAGLIGLRHDYDIAFGNDPDFDRHGIVTPSAGLLNPNHYLAAAVMYLFSHRPDWPAAAGIGKTLVSSSMIDRIASQLGRPLVEVPVGFKWFVDGLLGGSLGFGGEESAGASFLRRDGTVWTTDKDGIILNLLAAEITAVTGMDPGACYQRLVAQFGETWYARLDAPASEAQRRSLKHVKREQIAPATLGGSPIQQVLTQAPGNGEDIGGIKVTAADGWFAARPSGTEDIYKIYAESLVSPAHLEHIQRDARAIVDELFAKAEAG